MTKWALAFFLTFPLLAQEITTTQVVNFVASPTDIQNAGDGSGRLFLVQQDGIIRILRNGALVATPFLDIRTKTRAEGERGLLGLAFPPDFARKQRFYVNYTDLNGNTVIALYRVTSNPDVADAASEVILLPITQPFANHNGGRVQFGPDGYLYIGMGDGGSGGDPTLPVTEYNHSLGCSVTGGFIYRGQRAPRLRGVYLFGDFCSGRIWGFDAAGLRVLLSTSFGITTFGQDEAGEIYVADGNGGGIHRIDSAATPYVLNAASFDAGLTPGSLATVFTSGVVNISGVMNADRVPLPLLLGGISVTVDGIPAPVLAIANVNGVEQVNFQAPWEASLGADKKVVVTRTGQSASVNVPASPSQPAIFSGPNRRAVAVHNTGYTLVTDNCNGPQKLDRKKAFS